MISSISLLQDKSSGIVESNIQCKSRGMYSLNITKTYDTSSLSTRCIISPESNQMTPQKGSIFFMVDNNIQKMMTSNEKCLTVEIEDLIISECLSFNLSHKPSLKKVLDLSRTVPKSYQPHNRNLLSKDVLDVIHEQNMERNLSLI